MSYFRGEFFYPTKQQIQKYFQRSYLKENNDMEQSTVNDNTDQNYGNSKKTANPFYIEIDDNWTTLATKITELNSKIALKGERLVIQCQTDDDLKKKNAKMIILKKKKYS